MRIKFTDGTQPTHPTQQLRRSALNLLFSLFSKFLPLSQFYWPPLFALFASRADEVSHEILKPSQVECGVTIRNDAVRYRANILFSRSAEHCGYDP